MKEPNFPSEESIKLEFFQPDELTASERPLFADAVAAGFPSPAEDYIEKKLDLNQHLIKRPSSTFFVRVSGDSMTGAGILDGDLLIVDRSVSAEDNKVVIGVINGNFTVKRIRKKDKKIFLQPENPKFKEMEITPDMDFSIWGVVIYVIHKL
jgi:DNA polymerase V